MPFSARERTWSSARSAGQLKGYKAARFSIASLNTMTAAVASAASFGLQVQLR